MRSLDEAGRLHFAEHSWTHYGGMFAPTQRTRRFFDAHIWPGDAHRRRCGARARRRRGREGGARPPAEARPRARRIKRCCSRSGCAGRIESSNCARWFTRPSLSAMGEGVFIGRSHAESARRHLQQRRRRARRHRARRGRHRRRTHGRGAVGRRAGVGGYDDQPPSGELRGLAAAPERGLMAGWHDVGVSGASGRRLANVYHVACVVWSFDNLFVLSARSSSRARCSSPSATSAPRRRCWRRRSEALELHRGRSHRACSTSRCRRRRSGRARRPCARLVPRRRPSSICSRAGPRSTGSHPAESMRDVVAGAASSRGWSDDAEPRRRRARLPTRWSRRRCPSPPCGPPCSA